MVAQALLAMAAGAAAGVGWYGLILLIEWAWFR